MSAAEWWTAASKQSNIRRSSPSPRLDPSGDNGQFTSSLLRERSSLVSGSGTHYRSPSNSLSAKENMLTGLFTDSRSVSSVSGKGESAALHHRRRGECGEVWRMDYGELLDIVERATGMGRVGEVRRAGDAIVGLVSRKLVSAGAVMNAIVVGKGGGRRALIALGLVHRVCLTGPWALEDGWEEGMRVCERIKDIFGEGEGRDGAKDCLRMYAWFLETKLRLHGEFEEFEGNWSLDRYYRRVDVENQVDKMRRRENAERYKVIFHEDTCEKLQGLLSLAIRTAETLVEYDMQLDIIERVCADACNLYALTRYFDNRLFGGEENEELDSFRKRIRKVLLEAKARKGEVTPVLKRNVERLVIKMIMEDAPSRDQKPIRPESRFRKEVVCTFTSFDTMHEALAPPA